MIVIALLLVAPLSPAKVIDSPVSSHAAQARGRTRIERIQGRSRATIDLEWQRPIRSLMRYRENAADQTLFLSGKNLIAYDGTTREYIARTATGASMVQRMTKAVGPFEYAAQVLLDPAAMRAFLSPYR